MIVVLSKLYIYLSFSQIFLYLFIDQGWIITYTLCFTVRVKFNYCANIIIQGFNSLYCFEYNNLNRTLPQLFWPKSNFFCWKSSVWWTQLNLVPLEESKIDPPYLDTLCRAKHVSFPINKVLPDFGTRRNDWRKKTKLKCNLFLQIICIQYTGALERLFSMVVLKHRRRIKTEQKAKVVAAAWGGRIYSL